MKLITNIFNFLINDYVIIFIAAIIGFILAVVINYIPSKHHHMDKSYRQEIDLFIANNCYHIHHWMSLTLVLLFLFIGKFYSDTYFFIILIGLLIGIILEDFLFGDVFKIRNNCNI